jgi:hypothetical protein
MLPGVHQDVFDVPFGVCLIMLLNGGHQRGNFHEVGTGADDGNDFH